MKKKSDQNSKRNAPQEPDPGSRDSRPSRRRLWLFRIFTVIVVPALLLGVLELALRLGGFGYSTAFIIPCEVNGRAAFREDPEFPLRFFPQKATRQPCEFVFPAEKTPDTYRIFILGGSAAQGDPDPTFGFGRILDVLLRDRYPKTRFEVINAAFVAINSHVVVPIARDCARHEPDLFVLYLGNNEVVGPFGPGTVLTGQAPSLAAIRAGLWLKTTKIGQLLGAAAERLRPQHDEPQQWGGMEMFLNNRVRADDPRLETVYTYFRRNVSDICHIACRAGASIVVCTLPTNLVDCAPFASLHRADLTAAELTEWNQHYEVGIAAASAGHVEQAVEQFRQAAQIDDAFADLHYRLARCYQALADDAHAREHFLQARSLDALRFRVDERLDDVLRDVAAHGSSGCVHLVDAERIIAEQSPHGLPGADVFGDHVHFNFAGNYQLARAVYEQVIHILPARIRDAAPEDRPPLTKAECEERLAHTGWDRYRHIKRYLELSARPPFTNQLDHAERLARLQHDLAELEPYRQPAGLRAAAATYEAAIQRDPDDYPLRMNYAILLHEGLGDSADAVKQLRALLRIVPHHAEARHDLAQNLAALGRYDEAFAEFDEALRLRPNDPTIHNNLAVALAQTGRLDDAIAHFKDALRLQPDYPAAHNNLALALVKAGRFDEAITHYNEALRLDPNYRDAQRNLVEAHIARAGELMGQQRVDKAIRDYEAAAQLEPNVPELQYNLATALARTSRMAEAVQHFREALRLRPDWPPVANNLAWILATDGDPAIRNGAEAVALAEQICPPSRCEDPALLDTLAAAYAEAGRFADAVSTARRAIEWARSDQAQQLTAEIQQRLTLYEANRPYRTAAP